MKTISEERALEISQFSEILRKVGMEMFPKAKDAERIRNMAELLFAGEPAVKKWWYGQNAPRGGAAQAILRQLRTKQFDAELTEDMIYGMPDHPE